MHDAGGQLGTLLIRQLRQLIGQEGAHKSFVLHHGAPAVSSFDFFGQRGKKLIRVAQLGGQLHDLGTGFAQGQRVSAACIGGIHRIVSAEVQLHG